MNLKLNTVPQLRTIEHAGHLTDMTVLPGYLTENQVDAPVDGLYSCAFCGVGDSGRAVVAPAREGLKGAAARTPGSARGHCLVPEGSTVQRLPAFLDEFGGLRIETRRPLAAQSSVLQLDFEPESGASRALTLRAVSEEQQGGQYIAQHFQLYRRALSITDSKIEGTAPTTGCVKLRHSTHRQRGAYAIHTTPSWKRPGDSRLPLSYRQAIGRMAELLLEHRPNRGARTLVYACGQIDYFTIFAMQEVFRLLGIRNLTGNAEHCLNAGAVHNEILTGQEGPFLTIEQSIEGEDRFFLFNGWNGFVSHPPAFHRIRQRKDFDAYLIEVQVTESAKAVASALGADRVLLIRPRTDPWLAMSVAHEILQNHPEAIEPRFIARFADGGSFEAFRDKASAPQFAAEAVAARIAPEPHYVDRLLRGIKAIAARLAEPGSVPINIPSVGLSQTSGVVAHCIWGDIMAMLGKYGLRTNGQPAGGTLRIPGQINAETEVQGLSRKYFFGRVPMDHAADIARRMELPEDAYAMCVGDAPRAALDYSEPVEEPELMLFFGTQFEANMMGRPRWLRKLASNKVRMIVVDPIPDDYAVEHADLIVPSPPHPATTKLYQNGEWRLSLSVPQKRAAEHTRSDATIIYDVMAEIARRLEDPVLAAQHPDLVRHLKSGYLHRRFCPPRPGAGDHEGGLVRVEGEVHRPTLWRRIQGYMMGGRAPLYCALNHDDGRAIEWEELVRADSLVYGGVGSTRFVLDYERAGHHPFRDIFSQPGAFRFFVPKPEDLEYPTGVVLNSGRSCLSDERKRVLFATSTFNSGKATPIVDMPEANPVFVSPGLAEKLTLEAGDRVVVRNLESGARSDFPVEISDRVKGDTCYISFHKSQAALDRGECVNDVTSHVGRCAYSGQTRVKCTEVSLERLQGRRTAPESAVVTGIAQALPVWQGRAEPLVVVDILQETHDVFTFRLQGQSPCRFEYLPGQFVTLWLEIAGRTVQRSYTISSTPTRPFNLEITVKRVPGGLVSNWMTDELRVGDTLTASGPYGQFHLPVPAIPKKILLVGAGSGVTPCMSMARYLYDLAADVDIQFFNSVRSAADIIFDSEIDMLRHRSRCFSSIVMPETRGGSQSQARFAGRVSTEMFREAFPDLHERVIYMCGPTGFMEAVKRILVELDYDLGRLHTESFSSPVKPSAAVRSQICQIKFSKSDKVVESEREETVLELAEANGVELPYSCRTGSCGECRCRVIRGQVDMEGAVALTEEERAEGWILGCVAIPQGNLEVDA